MSLAVQILRSYRQPRVVMRARLAERPSEGRALAFVMMAALLIFVAQWPVAARVSYLDPQVPLDARIGGALFGILFLLPLICYLLAGVSHLVGRLIGGRGNPLAHRLALFWALLCVAPAMLLQGLITGFLGQGTVAAILGLAIAAAFLWIWLNSLIEAGKWS